MALMLEEINQAFRGSLFHNFRMLTEFHQAKSIELSPNQSSPLYLEDDSGKPVSLFIPLDATIGPYVICQNNYDFPKQVYVKKILDNYSDPLTLIDVGANIGLFSRQCLALNKGIKKTYCYEPNPSNFKLLERNFAGIKSVITNNLGLSNEEGVFDFHLDPHNVGNYSLSKSAMTGPFSSIQVQIANGRDQCDRWMSETDGNFVYKSDTQGFDEVIATSFDMNFWSRVKLAVFEIWRLPNKEYDIDRFIQVIDSFPLKAFQADMTKLVTAADIINYSKETDRKFDDVFLWR